MNPRGSGAAYSSKHLLGIRKETYRYLLGLGDILGVNYRGLLGQSTPVITVSLSTKEVSGFGTQILKNISCKYYVFFQSTATADAELSKGLAPLPGAELSPTRAAILLTPDLFTEAL